MEILMVWKMVVWMVDLTVGKKVALMVGVKGDKMDSWLVAWKEKNLVVL
jgi:hypothetical protein